MNTDKLVIKNTFYLATAELITKLIAFIVTIYVARYLQDTGFGKYSFVFAFTSLFAILPDLGLNTLVIREIARNKQLTSKYIGNVSLIKIILSIITLLLMIFTINIMNYPPDTTLAVYIIGGYVILNSFSLFSRSIYRAFERMEYETLTRIFERGVVGTLVIYLIYKGTDLIGISYAYLITGVLTLVVNSIIVSKIFSKPEFKIDLLFMKNTTKNALPFGLTAIFAVVYFKIDTVMLSIMEGDDVVGWYNASYNVIEGLSGLIAGSIAGVSFPLLSKYSIIPDRKVALKKVFIQFLQISLVSGLIVSIFVTIYAAEIIEFLYEGKYSNSIIVLQILIWAFFIICISYTSSTLLNAMNKQKIVAIGTGIGALLNISLNLILIPQYSLVGAAVATVLTELFGAIIYIWYVLKLLKINFEELRYLVVVATKNNMNIIVNLVKFT